MNLVIQILPEAAVLVAIVGAVHLLALAFRNPFRPHWLNRDWVASAAAIGIAAAVSMALGMMISGGVTAGLNVGAATALTLVTGFAAGAGVWRGFGIGERLRRADAGQSPFYPVAWAGALGRGWRRQFGGGAGA